MPRAENRHAVTVVRFVVVVVFFLSGSGDLEKIALTGAERGCVIYSRERRGICLIKNSFPPSIKEFGGQLFAITKHQEKKAGGTEPYLSNR